MTPKPNKNALDNGEITRLRGTRKPKTFPAIHTIPVAGAIALPIPQYGNKTQGLSGLKITIHILRVKLKIEIRVASEEVM